FTLLPDLLDSWADAQVAMGELAAAAATWAEVEALADMTRGSHTWSRGRLDALAWPEAEALRRIDLEERERGVHLRHFFGSARAVVWNAAGRYEAALEAAQRSCDLYPAG